MREDKGNVFVSPYSIVTALAMTSAGARGKTLDEMERALSLPEQEKLHPAARALLKQLQTAGKDKAAGKPTYPALFGLDASKALAAESHAQARQALERAGLLDSRLADIASWIIERKT